jgi:hypothetical protein
MTSADNLEKNIIDSPCMEKTNAGHFSTETAMTSENTIPRVAPTFVANLNKNMLTPIITKHGIMSRNPVIRKVGLST